MIHNVSDDNNASERRACLDRIYGATGNMVQRNRPCGAIFWRSYYVLLCSPYTITLRGSRSVNPGAKRVPGPQARRSRGEKYLRRTGPRGYAVPSLARGVLPCGDRYDACLRTFRPQSGIRYPCLRGLTEVVRDLQSRSIADEPLDLPPKWVKQTHDNRADLSR